MKIQFTIPYTTVWGENIGIVGDISELGNNDIRNAPVMHTKDGKCWQLEIELSTEIKEIKYKYFLMHEKHLSYISEWGEQRCIDLAACRQMELVLIQDFWRSEMDSDNDLLTSAFQNVIMHRKQINFLSETKFTYNEDWLSFHIKCPRIPEPYSLCILGSCEELGAWNEDQICEMQFRGFPNWQLDLPVSQTETIEYKYLIYDKFEEKVIMWENGENRIIKFSNSQKQMKTQGATTCIRTDEKFRFANGDWKGLGLSIPVFSMKSERSMGTGEFLDIEPMVDWASSLGIQLLQLLPINDTTVHHNKEDGYPYSSISVFALHPVYINLDVLDPENEIISKNELQKVKDRLNENEDFDYEEVVRVKEKYLIKFFNHQKETFFELEDFKYFYNKNEYWLKPYASFCYLRDLFGTADFSEWGEFAIYSKEGVDKLTDSKNPHYLEIAYHYYVQYHLYQQLKEASDYAREHKVVLKGDIPIGVSAYSVETWENPSLFCMDSQTGAPPDDFSADGQNWGFPTYNWERMEKDNYNWWTHRLEFMSEYFDAFRIDHILGFFRVWKIPKSCTQSLMGRFDPCLPFSENELNTAWKIELSKERLCEPCVNDHLLSILFSDDLVSLVKNKFLEAKSNRLYQLKSEFNTQKKVEDYFEADIPVNQGMDRHTKDKLKKGLFQIIADVLFLEDEKRPNHFIPRINFQDTYSYLILEPRMKRSLDELYTHFFYERHDKFWEKEGKKKLSKIKSATNMLIFGEDLGMVPEMVPKLIHKLGILSLNIQRMPKRMGEKFSDPQKANYLSVVSTSTHDMSVVRGWWAELSLEERSVFYYEILKKNGDLPQDCSSELVEEILTQHLYSPAMWSIFPIQDILALDQKLIRPYTEERINDPANPNNEWKYRIPKEIEYLKEDDEMNEKLKKLVLDSNRYNF